MAVPAQSAIQAALHPAAAQDRSNWKLVSTHLRKPWESLGVQHYETTLHSLSVGNYFGCSSREQGQANPSRPEQEVLHSDPDQHWLTFYLHGHDSVMESKPSSPVVLAATTAIAGRYHPRCRVPGLRSAVTAEK